MLTLDATPEIVEAIAAIDRTSGAKVTHAFDGQDEAGANAFMEDNDAYGVIENNDRYILLARMDDLGNGRIGR